MRVVRHCLGAAVAVSIGVGCASQAGVMNEPLHAGIGRTYDATFNRTLSVARESAVESGLKIESASQVDPDTYIIMCKASTSAWSWGEIVRLVVVRESDTQTTVRVVTKRKSAINIAAKGDYSNTLLSNIELKLKSEG